MLKIALAQVQFFLSKKFCRKKCGMLSLRKKEIPTKEILIKDREHLTLKEISNKYNIASSTLWYRLNN